MGHQFGLAFDEIGTTRRRQYGSSPDSPLGEGLTPPFDFESTHLATAT